MYRSIFTSLVLLAPLTAAFPQGDSFNISSRRGQDQDGYYIEVALQGIKPEQINITPHGKSLHLRTQQYSQTQQNTPNGQFSFTQGGRSMSQQFSFPPDANLSHMQVRNSNNKLFIAVPRFKR
jgi:HSP20 family molecular chaperone IbpA